MEKDIADNTFLESLRLVLSDPELHHVISWLPHGNAWKVHDHTLMVDVVLPKYFGGQACADVDSFSKQVEAVGFKRVEDAYHHELIHRDGTDWTAAIQRKKMALGGAKQRRKIDEATTQRSPEQQKQTIRPTHQSTNRNLDDGLKTFPYTLWSILSDEENHSIISWMPNGLVWKIHSQPFFISKIMPKYFDGQSHYQSFRRQVNGWGFTRHEDMFYHPLFRRDRPNDIMAMKRFRRKPTHSNKPLPTSNEAHSITTLQHGPVPYPYPPSTTFTNPHLSTNRSTSAMFPLPPVHKPLHYMDTLHPGREAISTSRYDNPSMRHCMDRTQSSIDRESTHMPPLEQPYPDPGSDPFHRTPSSHTRFSEPTTSNTSTALDSELHHCAQLLQRNDPNWIHKMKRILLDIDTHRGYSFVRPDPTIQLTHTMTHPIPPSAEMRFRTETEHGPVSRSRGDEQVIRHEQSRARNDSWLRETGRKHPILYYHPHHGDGMGPFHRIQQTSYTSHIDSTLESGEYLGEHSRLRGDDWDQIDSRQRAVSQNETPRGYGLDRMENVEEFTYAKALPVVPAMNMRQMDQGYGPGGSGRGDEDHERGWAQDLDTNATVLTRELVQKPCIVQSNPEHVNDHAEKLPSRQSSLNQHTQSNVGSTLESDLYQLMLLLHRSDPDGINKMKRIISQFDAVRGSGPVGSDSNDEQMNGSNPPPLSVTNKRYVEQGHEFADSVCGEDQSRVQDVARKDLVDVDLMPQFPRVYPLAVPSADHSHGIESAYSRMDKRPCRHIFSGMERDLLPVRNDPDQTGYLKQTNSQTAPKRGYTLIKKDPVDICSQRDHSVHAATKKRNIEDGNRAG